MQTFESTEPPAPSSFTKGIRGKWVSSRIFLVLSFLLAIIYFYLASESFSRTSRKTFDEAVYHHMGVQLQVDMSAYHAIPLALSLAPGRPIPDYLTQPLYKHPPLFSYFILIAQILGGSTYATSALVSAFFGAATILLVYGIGKVCYNALTGFVSAFLLAFNPIHAICGQKIWLATTLTFFMTAAVLLTLVGLKRKQPYLFLLASAAIGLATLTKYPGILALPLLAIPIWLSRPSKPILFGYFAIPFLFFLPWLQWNMEVYGLDLFYNNFVIHFAASYQETPLTIWLLVGFSICLFCLVIWALNNPHIFKSLPKIRFQPPIPHGRSLLAFAIVGALIIPVMQGLSWHYFPETSWALGFFHKEPFYFYIERMLIYSPLFLGAFLVPLWFRQQPNSARYLFIYAYPLLIFYILWDNFQCRYIEPVIPVMAILAAHGLVVAMGTKMVLTIGKLRIPLSVLVALVSCYAVIRMIQFNIIFSYPNTACYF